MGPKGSHLVFGESDIGESLIDGPDSIIGNPRATKEAAKEDRVSKMIPEVII